MSREDRRLIWALLTALGGIYVLLLPLPLAWIAGVLSTWAAIRAINGR